MTNLPGGGKTKGASGAPAVPPDTCWFGEKRPAGASAADKVIMYGNVVEQWVSKKTKRVQWINKTVLVPRCAQCKATHSRMKDTLVLGTTGAVLGALGGIVLTAIYESYAPAVVGGAVLVGSFVVMAVRGRKLAEAGETKGLGAAQQQFPVVLALKEQGWRVGKKPPGAQG